ncbi:MAG: hypothetical protein Q4D81_11760 [Eubacteriales bacterium]|nr:hypothetical protein [Eubacteriales bacterium]
MKKTNAFEGKIISEIVYVNNAHKKRVPDGRGGTKEIAVPGKMLDFYWEVRGRRSYLFRQRYTGGVHEIFKDGVRDFEVRNFRRWNRNPRLDKTLDKIPVYIADALRESA